MVNRPGTQALLLLLTVFSTLPTLAQPQPDTLAFARHMTPYRQLQRDLTAAEVKSIQAEYLAWLNVRVAAGMGVEQMNIELNSGKLLTASNSANPNDLEGRYTGFVGTIHSNAVDAGEEDGEEEKVPDDLLLFLLPIHTGAWCNEDETLVLYNRESRQRLGWMNGYTTYWHGLRFGAVAAQPQRPDGTRLVATDWIASNCTSNWNGQVFRIDSLSNGRATQVLNHTPALGAMAGSTKIQIDKDTVQFTYYSSANVADPDGSLPLPVERYRVQGTRALRLEPLAETLEGFISEWLGIEDTEALRFGAPSATTQHRALRTRLNEEWYSFTAAAECPGTPPTHQVRALWDKSKRTTYFRVSGDTAATFRMQSVADSPSPGCHATRLEDIRQRLR